MTGTLRQTDECRTVELVALVYLLPPRSTLSVDNGGLTFALDYYVVDGVATIAYEVLILVRTSVVFVFIV